MDGPRLVYLLHCGGHTHLLAFVNNAAVKTHVHLLGVLGLSQGVLTDLSPLCEKKWWLAPLFRELGTPEDSVPAC